MFLARSGVLPSVLFYEEIARQRTPDELHTLSHIKRFLELLTGDAAFHHAMARNPEQRQELVNAQGINIQVRELWRPKADSQTRELDDLSDLPLAVLWQNWIKDLRVLMRMIKEDGYSSTMPFAYNSWRNRQVERVSRELGPMRADGITHAVMAFELSTGCTLGCWFCGLGAIPFQGRFERTPSNVKLWRQVLGVALDLFGLSLQTSFCYWATEPFDNPNYLDFLEDYRDVVGILPQTTSAAPLRDLVWTRRLMEMHRESPGFPSRFSILSRRILKQLHSTFSPEELLFYELPMQHGESRYPKDRAGKTLKSRHLQVQSFTGRQVIRQPTTIACVSGFCVNMMKKSIQLISPCQATERWPLGYRVHMEGSFNNSQQLGDFIERAVANSMPVELPNNRPVRFREGFKYEPKDDGFKLITDLSSQSVEGSANTRRLGDLIAEGCHSPAEIINRLLGTGAEIFELRGTLKDLFRNGLLDDSSQQKPDDKFH